MISDLIHDGMLLQSPKADSPIVVSLFRILMLLSELQAANAISPMIVTLLGMLMLVSELQPSYLQPIITQYFIDNKSEIWLLFLIAHSKR